MKKYVIFILLALVAIPGFAQNNFVPRQSCYYYSWWYENYMSDTTHHQWLNRVGNTGNLNGDAWHYPAPCGYGIRELALECQTSNPLEIVGLAISTYDARNFCAGENDRTNRDSAEYARVYQSSNDSMILLKEIQINTLQIKDSDSYRFIRYDARTWTDHSGDTCRLRDYQGYMGVAEYYFDSAITVNDKFYLSLSFNNSYGYWGSSSVSTPWHYRIYPQPYWGMGDGNTYVNQCHEDVFQYPTFPYKTKLIDLATGQISQWHDTLWHIYVCIFPIINYESPLLTRCDSVTGLSLVSHEGNTYTFSWNGVGRQTRWQYCYAPIGTDPNQMSYTECASTTATVTVDPDVQYVFYARGICTPGDHPGLWCRGIPFSGPSSDTTSITLVDAYTAIAPNPASTELYVNSSFDIDRIEFFTLSGTLEKQIQCSGHSIKADISQLPNGIYLVKVYTEAGSITRKIVILH